MENYMTSLRKLKALKVQTAELNKLVKIERDNLTKATQETLLYLDELPTKTDSSSGFAFSIVPKITKKALDIGSKVEAATIAFCQFRNDEHEVDEYAMDFILNKLHSESEVKVLKVSKVKKSPTKNE